MADQTQLIFACPPQGPERIEVYRVVEDRKDPQVTETYYRLRVIKGSDGTDFDLPFDFPALWECVGT